jgi:hypothetical protein
MSFRNESKEFLLDKYLDAFKINKKDLLDLSNSINFNRNNLYELIVMTDLEEEIKKKVNNAKSYLRTHDFKNFWSIFLYFIKGEIKTKIEIKKFIELKNKAQNRTSAKINGRTIVISSLFINTRSELLNSFYEYIVNSYQKKIRNQEKTAVDIEISNFVYTLISTLKITLNTKSNIEKLIKDDLTISIMTAYNITQKFIKV